MSLSAESWLVLLLVGFYLQDSCLALGPDEAALEHRWRGRWAARFGARQWRLAGKELLLANPFTPQRALFRLRWAMDSVAAPAVAAQPLMLPRELARLSGFVWVAWLLLFVALPWSLWTHAGSVATLAIVLLLYLNNAVALLLAYRWRVPFGIARKPFVAMALECLACAPYAVNLVRRLCTLMAVQEDFTQAAARLLDAPALARANTQCLTRIDEQIELEAEASPRSAALQAARSRFLDRSAA